MNLQDLHGKGWQTTEFWLMGVLPQVIAGASWLAAHAGFIPGLPPWSPAALTGIAQVATIVYGLMRTNVKTTAMNTVAAVAQAGATPPQPGQFTLNPNTGAVEQVPAPPKPLPLEKEM